MADVVNDTHKTALSQRNSEPTHLGGGSKDDLGGPPVGGGGMESYKIDAARGMGTDSSIPKSVPAEGSHLKSEESGDDDDVDVSFDDEDNMDDLDEALTAFEDFKPVDVDVDMKEEDEKDEEDMVKEEDEKDEDNPFVKEEDDKEDKDNPFVKEEDEKDDDNPFVKEEDEKDDKDNPFVKEEDEEDKDKEPVSESVKLHIKLPKTNLFESVNITKKDQKKVGVVFESVMKATTKQISEQLATHYKKLHEQKIAQHNALLAKQVDSYLSYVVETWVAQNRPAIRQSLRTQLSENFLNGLQKLFKEHYIDVPESKVDVVKQLSEQLEATKTKLNEQTGRMMKLRRLTESINKARIVADFARKNHLSEEQTNKLNQLSENVSYKDAKTFRSKLSMLKESYLGGKRTASDKALPVLTEETITEAAPAKVSVGSDADIAAIAAVIERSAKNAGY